MSTADIVECGSGKGKIWLVCMSDTHTMHESIPFAEVATKCDPDRTVILHSGDWTKWPNWRVTADFNQWMGSGNAFLSAVPRDRKIACPGNHDDGWQNCFRKGELPGALNFILLENSSTTVRIGEDTILKVFGTTFENPDVRSIPGDCDILLTHSGARRVDRLNDPEIVAAVSRLPPAPHLYRRVHVSGHAHERYFCEDSGSTTFIGASLSDSKSPPLRAPIIFCPTLR